MNFIYIFGIFAIGAYILQAIMGMKQIKNFNSVYQELRSQGKVAIGRRSGKLRAGTLTMFAIDKEAKIVSAKKMQGVTVFAKFHDIPEYIGQDIHYIDKYNPLVQKENKLTQQAMENAREIYLRVDAGNYTEEQALSPFLGAKTQLNIWKNQAQQKMKRSTK